MTTPTAHPEQDTPRAARAVHALIALNVAILFLQRTVVTDADAFALLGFREGSLPRMALGAATYTFAHYGVWHLVVNMYALLAFGPRLEAAMGARGFTLYYLWCGLGGAAAQLLFAPPGILIGSSSSVLGVMYGYAQHWSADELAPFGVARVRAWSMLLFLAVINVALGMIEADAAGADRMVYLAHLGGLVFAWLYFRAPAAASIERLRQRISPAPDYQDESPPRAVPRTLPRQRVQRDEVDEVVAKSKAISAQQRPVTRTTAAAPRTADVHAAEVDRLLDKISSQGLESLTADERALLDAIAKRLRGEH